jgi:hypothetical protein
VNSTGGQLEIAQEDLCWICGTSLESWPLEKKQPLIDRILSDGNSRKEFALVRSGVKAAMSTLLRQEAYVFGTNDVKLTVKDKDLAFIDDDNFVKHFGCPVLTSGFGGFVKSYATI